MNTQRSIDESSPYILLPSELARIIVNNLQDVLRRASNRCRVAGDVRYYKTDGG